MLKNILVSDSRHIDKTAHKIFSNITKEFAHITDFKGVSYLCLNAVYG